MNISVLPTAKYTVTILNRLKAQDSPTHRDIWYKNVLQNSTWSASRVRNVAGNTVSVGGSTIARISKNTLYIPYAEWITHTDTNITFSTGDYLILGEIEEEVTPENVLQIIRKYKPNAFEIKFFKDNTGLGLANHYHLEGV